MVRAVFLANLLLSAGALGAAALDAVPDRERLALLGFAVPYGVLLEQLVILRFERYRYPVGEYLLTLADVPVVIGFGWAAIVYAGYRTARRFGVSDRRLPFFVGLFALHIDLAIDAVAIRVGFWSWTPPGAWFGVPLGNFLGWFLVASLYAGAWVGLRDRVSRPALRGALSVVLAVGALIACLQVWEWVATTPTRKAAVLAGVLALAGWLVGTDDWSASTLPWGVSAVPVLFHGFYLGTLVWFGFYRSQPLLLVVSLAMLAVTGLLHVGHVPRLAARLRVPVD